MQLSSYLSWEAVLKCRPGRSRTLDIVRSVSLLNAFFFFFFIFYLELKVGAPSSSQRRENEGHAADFTSFSVLLDATLSSALAVSLLCGYCFACSLITVSTEVECCVYLGYFMFLRRCGPVGCSPGESSVNDQKSGQHSQ